MGRPSEPNTEGRERTADLGDDASLPPPGLVLIVTAGPDRRRRLALPPGTYVIGTAAGCDLVLHDPSVSRTHLEIAIADGRIDVRDLGSRNGSRYRGARFTSLRVPPGAIIHLGRTEVMVAAVSSARDRGPERDCLGRLYGRSRPMQAAFRLLEQGARANVSILVTGETGTGKELAAEAIHRESSRRAAAYVVCDLAAMSPTLIESELFGHVRGAFTGAERDRAGAFELADRGTIFLDEIGELALDLQPRLLRVLDSGHVKRLGDTRHRTVDVRVVAATNRDLQAEVAAGRFREDLYHRLAVMTVRLPPLRARIDDLSFLIEVMLADLSARQGRPLRMTPSTVDVLAMYEWPGNVRQLRNVLERAAAMATDDGFVQVAVPDHVGGDATLRPTGPAPVDLSVEFKPAKERLLHEWELEYVTALLARCDDNVTTAARRAGIDRVHFHRLLRKHGLSRTKDARRSAGDEG